MGSIAALAIAVVFAVTPPVATPANAVDGSRQLQRQMEPSKERLELPDFEVPERVPSLVLPPIDLSDEPDSRGFEAGRRVFVSGYRFRGNTVFSDAELAERAEPWAGREIDFGDLQVLRDQLTQAYVERGFVSSGAVIPDQRVEDGFVEIEIVEGRLTNIVVSTDGRLRGRYLRSRLERAMQGPANIAEIERQLQILQSDRRVRAIDAELVPGNERGESTLRVAVREERPVHVEAVFSNHVSPSVGSLNGAALLAWDDITGWGDGIEARYSGSEGYQEVEGEYSLPVTRWDTRLGAHARTSWGKIIEEPFDSLDIRSRTLTVGASLRQPFQVTSRDVASLGVVGEWWRSRTTLLGEGFNLSDGPSTNGVSKVAVLRLEGDWVHRGRDDVFALRSTLSWGMGILDATINSSDTPDGRFLSWLGQLQWTRRFRPWDLQLIVREDFQLSNEPLLSLEQFAMGGWATVRGYRENQLVRDQGVIGSIELRLPVIRRTVGSPWLEIASFLDHGYSFERDRVTEGPQSLFSIGLGLRSALPYGVNLQFYWGHALRNIEQPDDSDIQDDGIHFSVSVGWP